MCRLRGLWTSVSGEPVISRIVEQRQAPRYRGLMANGADRQRRYRHNRRDDGWCGWSGCPNWSGVFYHCRVHLKSERMRARMNYAKRREKQLRSLTAAETKRTIAVKIRHSQPRIQQVELGNGVSLLLVVTRNS